MSEQPLSAGVPTCYRHPGRETYIRCQRCSRPICPDCMRDAAVGHQCPDCVAQGRRQTRSGQAVYGGRRSANPALTSMVLIGINLAIWVAIVVTGGGASVLFRWLALTPGGSCVPESEPAARYTGVFSEAVCDRVGGGIWYPGVADGAGWQLLTSAFTHVTILHLAVNMLAVWFLGPNLERLLGRTRFLALYLVSALAGSTAVMWLSGSTTSTLGASGAVFGLLGAMVVIALKVGGDVQQLLIWLGINVVITFAVPNVSWQGHLGGLIGGAAVAVVLVFAPRRRRPLLQAGGIGVLVALLAAATITRSLVLL